MGRQNAAALYVWCTVSLTILALADQVDPRLYDYFDAERWRHVDLILSCGDLPPDYLDFLCSTLGVPIFYVRGNHDSSFPLDAYSGFTNLHARMVEYKGLRLAGFEGSNRYNQGRYQYSQNAMRRLVRRGRLRAWHSGPPDIVISHAPPAGCHDASDVCHQGFEAFRTLIDAWHPLYFIHGHVHAYERGEAETRLGETTVLNAFPSRVISVPVHGETQESKQYAG